MTSPHFLTQRGLVSCGSDDTSRGRRLEAFELKISPRRTMDIEGEVVSGWYFICYVIAWVMAIISSMIVAVIVLRQGTAMR